MMIRVDVLATTIIANQMKLALLYTSYQFYKIFISHKMNNLIL